MMANRWRDFSDEELYVIRGRLDFGFTNPSVDFIINEITSELDDRRKKFEADNPECACCGRQF